MLDVPAKTEMAGTLPENSDFPAPLVTYVCPPERVRFVWYPVLLCLVAVAAILIWLIVIRHSWQKTLGLGLVLPTLVFACFGGAYLARRYRRTSARLAFLGRHPRWDADPLAASLGAEWRRTLEVPRAEVLRKLVPADGACRVLFFGVAERPHAAEPPDEPTIFTPTERIQFWIMCTATSLIMPFGMWALAQVGILRVSSTLVDGRMIGAAWVVVLIALVWAWFAGVRPVYIRLAPRMIQFLRYSARSRPPRIHSYPAAAGTIVCADYAGKLYFVNAVCEDRWNTYGSAFSPAPLALVLACLHANRPTPPLSETELVG